MKQLILLIFLIFFSIRCSGENYKITEINQIVNKEWLSSINDGDYNINDFWPAEEDSSLFVLLSEFRENNRDMKLLDIKAKISSIYYDFNKADFNPKISSSLNGGYAEQNLETSFGSIADYIYNHDHDEESEDTGDNQDSSNYGVFGATNYSANLSALWEIDIWGKMKNAKNAMRFNMNSDLYDVKYAQISLTAQFIKLYISSIQANNQIKLINENLSNLKKIKEITDKRILEGLSSTDEIYLASADYHLYQSSLIAKEIELRSFKNNLELMLGRYPGSLISLSYKYPTQIYSVPPDLSSDLLLRRPDILSEKEKLKSSESMLIANNRALFPSFSMTVSSGQSSAELKELFDPDNSIWNIGLNVLQPIFQSGKIKKNIEKSKEELLAADIQYVDIVVKAFYETENYLDLDKNLQLAQEKIEISRQDMQKAVDYAIRGYELGLVDLLYVLNLQQRLFDVKIQLENIIAQRYLNRINLILALGGNFEY